MGTQRPTAENWSCGFEPNEVPADWCAKPATWHGFQMDAEMAHIVAMRASCDDHLVYMGKHADWVHPMKSVCGLPGSRFRWPKNECYIRLDLDLALAGLMAAEAGQRDDGS